MLKRLLLKKNLEAFFCVDASFVLAGGNEISAKLAELNTIAFLVHFL